MMNKSLKIGFIIDQTAIVPLWYAETIKKIISQANVTVFFIAITRQETKEAFPIAYKLFKRFEEWWFTPSYDAFEQIKIDSLISKPKYIHLTDQQFLLNEKKLNHLKQYELDLVYSIDFSGEEENISEASGYGLWYIKFGSEKYAGIGPEGFWEVMENSAVTGSYLLARKNKPEYILYDGTTVSVPYSVRNNFNFLAWKSSTYLAHSLHWLTENSDYSIHDFPIFSKPTLYKPVLNNFRMVFLFVRNIFRYLASKLKRAKHFRLFFSGSKFSLDTLNTITFQQLPFTDGSFLADPFVIEADGRHYIFFEEYVYSKNKGHISVIEINNKEISPPKVILDRSYHLSYPFVFSYLGNYYMVPETSSDNTVQLYKAKAFPYEWEFVMNLIENKQLIDVTIHFENGKWWLFALEQSHPAISANDQLFLFYSNDLFSSTWIPHPQNPIATHINNCRPAGRLFKHNNKLYRPSQNNASKQYGAGLKINEVIVLNEHQYLEKEVLEIDTIALGLQACHHIDFSENFVVIDGIAK